jgi:hypothetical protein
MMYQYRVRVARTIDHLSPKPPTLHQPYTIIKGTGNPFSNVELLGNAGELGSSLLITDK